MSRETRRGIAIGLFAGCFVTSFMGSFVNNGGSVNGVWMWMSIAFAVAGVMVWRGFPRVEPR